ncbi:hypothetical protein DPMN_138546 [Dreissena polymorpha]|uniref:Uncharacterized protein n=1 Tax=Dreissena polymorpha TaxID=45954 RepID=A0A9D4G418_DREPO|nr:hypothetical protein DPMN_138546 [Dreissena polymorpha]
MASNYPLGQTQRREFSDILNQNQNEESGGSSRQSPIDMPADVDETEKKEKQRCMGLKYLAFSIVVCGLLAGVIVAVVFGKKSLTDKRQKLPLGGILSTERPIGK